MKAEKIGYSKDPLSVHYMKEIKRLFDPKGLLNPYKVRHFCAADAMLVPAERLSRETSTSSLRHSWSERSEFIYRQGFRKFPTRFFVATMSYGTHREVGNVEKREQ